MKPKTPLIDFIRRHLNLILVIGIVALAAFFRFYQLHSLPPGLHPDEAANGLDIFRILEHHDIRPLYNTNGPRESLFFFLQAIFVVLFKNTVYALRVAPAIIGTLGVLATYLWLKSWFGNRVALVSSFIMAVLPWSVTISRDGFRASMTPLFVALTLWLYTRALQTGKTRWFIFGGLSLGAGMYTYLAFRLFPLALVAALVFAWIWRRPQIWPFRKQIVLSLIAFTIALVPMGVFGVKHPGDVFARAAGTSVLNKDLNHGHPINALADSVVKTALMFNFHGDENYRQNLGGYPELNVFVGLMFILGLLIALTNITKLRYFALLAVFGVMLLPEALTAEGIPHALRAIGAVGATVALAGLGVEYLLDLWYRTFPVNTAARSVGLSAILMLLALTAYQGYTQYFVAWAQAPQTYEAYSEDATQVADYVNRDHFAGQRFVVIDGYSDKTVQYLTHDLKTHQDANYRRIDPSDINALPRDGKPKEFVIVRSQKEAAVNNLRLKFPGGKVTPHYSSFNDAELFYVYQVTK